MEEPKTPAALSLAEIDALLGEHAAQLRDSARRLLGIVNSTREYATTSVSAAGMLARTVQTNIAIARTVRANAKTVHGGAAAPEPQD